MITPDALPDMGEETVVYGDASWEDGNQPPMDIAPTAQPTLAGQPFEEVYVNFQPGLLQRAFRLTRNHDDAEDLVQETFAKALRGAAGYRDGNLGSWLSKILHNGYFEGRRQTQRRRTFPYDSSSSTSPETFAAEIALHRMADQPQRSPEESVIEALNETELRAAIRTHLAPDFAATLMSRIDGLSYQEIADQTGVSLTTVRSRHFRARRRLTELYKNGTLALPDGVSMAQLVERA